MDDKLKDNAWVNVIMRTNDVIRRKYANCEMEYWNLVRIIKNRI
jgi:hypothetical protein